MTQSKVLVIDDNPAMLSLMNFHLHEAGYQVTTAETGEEGLQRLGEENFEIVLTDLQLPGLNGIELIRRGKQVSPATEFLMVTGYPSLEKARESVRAGAFYVVEKPVDFAGLLELLEKAHARQTQVHEIAERRARLAERSFYYNLIGQSSAMQHIYEIIESIAEAEANVLILGEPGTGKELVANAIHYRSQRACQPFEKINCAALPPELLETELFGYLQGAFPGAQVNKTGVISHAAGGSLWFDEIAEIPHDLQHKLLRVLQERVYYRLGSEQPLPADFRFIASTSHPLPAALQSGELWAELYYRINTIEINLPPLRERPEDIRFLAEHFLQLYSAQYQRALSAISAQSYEKLLSYDWPGNVSELENVIERAVLLASDEVLEIHPLSFAPAEATRSKVIQVADSEPVSQQATIEQLCQQIIQSLPTPEPNAPLGNFLRELDIYLTQAALERTRGNKQAAASLLGIYRPRLYSLLRQAELFTKKKLPLRRSASLSSPLTSDLQDFSKLNGYQK